MKNITLATFSTREDAEKAINQLHNELNINHDDISYVYKNTDNEVREVDTKDVSSSTPKEGAVGGAKIGGTIGAIAGIATVIGVIPVIGPVFAAGPLMAALGLTGAIGTTAAGAVTGAAAGGLVGALMNLGVGEENAKRYADYVTAGNVLVSVHSDEEKDPSPILLSCRAEGVERFSPTV